MYERSFLIALGATLMVETIVLLGLSRLRRDPFSPERIAGASILASTLTIPYVWFVFPPLAPAGWGIASGEAFAFLAEALIYRRLLPASWPTAILYSAAANLASYLFGIYLISPWL